MTINWQKTVTLLAGLLVCGQLAAHQNLADKFEKLADAVVVIHTTERAANPNQSSGLTSIAEAMAIRAIPRVRAATSCPGDIVRPQAEGVPGGDSPGRAEKRCAMPGLI